MLNNVNKCRDLGVLIDEKLTFRAHVIDLVARAKQRMSLILRSFVSRDPQLLMQSFKSFILPIVDYCSQVWSPYLIQDIILIESIQRRFTKRIPGLARLSYTERLTLLNSQTLERRRLEFDLILCFKILRGFIQGPPEAYGLVLSQRRSRGHSLKIDSNQTKTDLRKFYFASRVREPWNSLTEKLIMSNTIKQFKTGLHEVNLNKFLIMI